MTTTVITRICDRMTSRTQARNGLIAATRVVTTHNTQSARSRYSSRLRGNGNRSEVQIVPATVAKAISDPNQPRTPNPVASWYGLVKLTHHHSRLPIHGQTKHTGNI